MNRKLISAVFLIPLLSILSIIVLFTPTIPVVDPETGAITFIPLIRPPLSIVQATDAGALDTSSIALFGWINMTDEYGAITGWDVNDAVGVMLNYTSYDDAVDGFVRVWDGGSEYTCTDANPDYDNCYVDVAVRVRSDTVLIAYVNQSQTDSLLERGVAYIYWNHTLETSASAPDYGMVQGRAMEIIVEDGLSATWSGDESGTLNYTRVNYYDYEHTSTDKLFVFGSWDGCTGVGCTTPYVAGNYEYFYFTVESGSTLDEAILVQGAYAYGSNQMGNVTLRVFIDDSLLGGITDTHDGDGNLGEISGGWWGHDVSSYITVGVQSKISIYTDSLHFQIADRCRHNIGVIVWTH
jgi:hypothetical protein